MNGVIMYFNTPTEELVGAEWVEDVRKHQALQIELDDGGIDDVDGALDTLVDGEYTFWVEVINDSPYRMSGYALCSLSLYYCCSRPSLLYIQNDRLNNLKEIQIKG